MVTNYGAIGMPSAGPWSADNTWGAWGRAAQNRITRLRVRAAKCKDPKKRARLIAMADALAAAVGAGAPPEAIDAAANVLDTELNVAGVPDVGASIDVASLPQGPLPAPTSTVPTYAAPLAIGAVGLAIAAAVFFWPRR